MSFYDSFRNLHRMMDQMSRFDFPAVDHPADSGASAALVPAASQEGRLNLDVHEDRDAIVVAADLPGFKKDEVKVTCTDGVLTITGDRAGSSEKDEEDAQGRKWHVKESHSGWVQRSVRLPKTADVDGVSTTYENGQLKLSFPKKEHTNTKTIAF